MCSFLKKRLAVLFFYFWLFTVVGPLLSLTDAASFRFNPTSAKIEIDTTVSFDVIVDTGGDNVTSVETFIEYDSQSVQIVSVKEGSFFPSVSYNTDVPGKLYIAGVVSSAGTYKTGEGILASVSVKGLQNKTVLMTFYCVTGSTTDSNIAKNNLEATDIISCQDNNSYELVIGTGSSVKLTGGSSQNNSTAGNYGAKDNTISPTSLPKTGTADKVVIGVLSGIVFLVIAGIVKILL